MNIYCEQCGLRPKQTGKKWCYRCINIYRRKKSGKVCLTDIPQNYLTASFEDFPDTKDLRFNLSKDENLYFYGDVGTGKTHMIYAIIKYARAILFYSAEVVEFTRLCSEIRKGFNGAGESEYDVIKRYAEYDLLCIDDLGLSSNISDFAYLTFYQILDKRINECLPTIISSNKTIGEIGKMFDQRIASRLGLFKVIEFKGLDKRKAGVK